MNKTDNIKDLWSKLEHGSKTTFIELVAFDLGKSPNTLHNHWFARWWQIPEEFKDRVIELLQKTIAQQNKAQV